MMLSWIITKYRNIMCRRLWRRLNSHNFTYVENAHDFPIEKVSVGKLSYGSLYVKSYGADIEYLEIGDYCSIAQGVKFILGGGHPMDTISQYPFKAICFGQKIIAFSKGKIVVENDVWIGTDVTILSGCTIGEGAIVAAGSIITKSVEPYTLVGGNPARLIRKRFDDDLISYLLKIDKPKLLDKLVEAGKTDLLYKELTLSYLKELEAEYLA